MEVFLKQSAEFLPILMQGLRLTIIVTIGSLVLSTVLGMVWALMRVSGVPLLAGIAKTFVNVIRGIPIIVQLFYIYFVLPDLGISLTAVQAAIIGLGIAYSAYQSENFRAGIEAIDRGQVEAAQSIGMGWALTMRRVLLPQAFKIVLPPYGNIMIMMLKELVAGLHHHGRRAGLAGQADRLLDLSEHDRLHARRRPLPVHEPAAHLARVAPRGALRPASMIDLWR